MKSMLVISVFLLSSFSIAASVDQKLSEVSWEGSKIVGDKHYGKIPVKSGEINFTKKSRFKDGFLVLDLKEFTVEDLSGKYAKKFIKHMKSDDFFDVEKWPTAKIKITKMRKGSAKGLMTIKDKTEKIKFKYNEEEGFYTGKFSFDRTKFGMTYGSKSFFKNLGDKVISDDVKVSFKIKLQE